MKTNISRQQRACKTRIVFLRKKQMSPPFRNKKITNVTRRIIWKIYMQELCFLCMSHCLNVLYKYMKVHWKTSNGYQVIDQTRNNIANDQREKIQKYPKQSYVCFCFFDSYQVKERTPICDRQTHEQTLGGGRNIHARVMVLVQDTSSECALQMYEVSLKNL